MDSIYYQFADIVNKNSTEIFKENLGDITDFRDKPPYYLPILSSDKNINYTKVDYFRSPGPDYLTEEIRYDNMTKRKDSRLRRSPLSQDMGNADKKQIYVYEQRDINNTSIMRGFHVTVRDYDMNIINDEYGPKGGPFNDSRTTAGKLIWYRPHDTLHPNYTIGEELRPDFVMPRGPKFKIDYYDDKRAVYFQRVKKSIYLPRCLRELETSLIFLRHDWIRCPAMDQEPVLDEFYETLGIEKNKDYIFEFVNVW